MTERIERWHQVSELFDRVADLEPEARERLLDAECAHDPDLRAEVERLLRADGLTNPLDHDIAAQASALLLEGDPEQHYGQLFGPYRIQRLLGQGGMGRVYLAQREGEDFTQTVALKLIGGFGSFEAGLARRRFLDERRILARLVHPHIARLLDGGVGPETQPWFAMEYVDGAPLTAWCNERKIGVQRRLALFAKVCDAVDHAHRFLIVHRDLKPGNVLVDAHGEPKVLDFGIAKLLDEGAQPAAGSTIVMTPDYAAPEQLRGGMISTATDVYSLGAMLFELLTGQKPFIDALASREPPPASRSESLPRHATACSTTPQGLRKALRGDLDRILRTALNPDPAHRYRSAARLAEDLRAVVAGEPISLRSDRAYRVGIFLRRHRLGVAAASAAVLALMGTTGWALWQMRESARHAQIAEREALASESVSELLISAFEAVDPMGKESARQLTAKDVLDASAAKVTEVLAETPDIRARMQALLGRAYLNLENFDAAAVLLDAAISGYRSDAVNRPEAADAMIVLALVEMNRSNGARAKQLIHEAIAMTEKDDGAPSQQMLSAYNTLGMILMTPGQYEESRKIFETAHPMREKAYGASSKEVAISLHNQAQLASSSGRVRDAERLFREVLIMEARTENSRPQSAYSTRSLLALALAGQGRFDEAERLLRKNAALTPTLYPQDSPHHSRIQGRLAGVYEQRGQLVRAEQAYREAIAAVARASGADPVRTAYLYSGLAQVLETRGVIDEAQGHHRRAEQLLDTVPGKADLDDRWRIVGRYEVFLARQARGYSPERLASMLNPWIAVHGPDRRHIPADLAEALFLLAERRIVDGQLDGVEALLPPAVADPEQPLQQAHRHYWLARLRAARGDFDGAVTEFERAIDMAEAVAGKASATPALWRLDYAEQLAGKGRVEPARRQLDLAAPVLADQLLPKAPALERLERIRRTEPRRQVTDNPALARTD